MKFEYDKEEDRGEVVAFITAQGNLMFTYKLDNGYLATLCRDGAVHTGGGARKDDIVKKFYRGDKVTITF